MGNNADSATIHSIDRCRITKSRHLIPVLNLGEQCLTGVFPTTPTQTVTKGPLELVWCPEGGLLQLRHSYSLSEMYGDNYGYRSGLNSSMVSHLAGKIAGLQRRYPLQAGDCVLDIGSNDGTLLNAYALPGLTRVGMDPTANKFRSFYHPNIVVSPDFFSADRFLQSSGGKKARIITAIAMFYDLEDPDRFVQDIKRVLADDGIWHFEQSYMPSMLRTTSYDTVCHEHLEYYSLQVISSLLQRNDMRILDVQMNSINGGSVAVTACHSRAPLGAAQPLIQWMLKQEERWELGSPKPYREFEDRVFKHREDLQNLIDVLVSSGKTVLGYGASTKGNVLLQFCQFSEKQISAIADVNPDKVGRFTPGTAIPIISEAEAHARRPDYFLVLPWHFKPMIVHKEREFLAAGGKLIFPLPEIEIVGE